MSEKPIKLFGGRADRYPEADDAEFAEGIARAAIKLIPFVGGATNDVLNLVLAPAIVRRRDEWFKELAEDLDKLDKEVKGLKERLSQNEPFVSAVIQATRIALSTHQQEKRQMLRYALLKIATGKGPDEELQQVFLNAIEEFSVSHVKVLNVLANCTQELIQRGLWNSGHPNSIPAYRNVIALLLPELRTHESLVVSILIDLRNRGFSKLADLDVPFPNQGMVTNLGAEFLRFVSS